jgi:hypothetical protein
MSSKCYRKRSQRGGAAKEVTGFNSIPYAAAVAAGPNSQAAMMAKIPQSIAEQGMNFQKMTSTYHRTRKGRKQRGGAAPVENTGAVLPSSMTGPMTTVASGVLGGSATGRLDTMLSQTSSLVKQVGGGSRKRKQKKQQKKQQKTRKQKKQQQQRQQQQQQQQQQSRKQRGGSHQPLGFGPAAPTSGDYTILSPQELKAAGLNPQWFDENQVNPGFGGAITVPGGKLN